MGRAPCCDKSKVKKGAWSPEEDFTLKNYLQTHGSAGNWITLPLKAGLKRCGKSCRLRWLNYLRPDIKHGPFTKEEDTIILNLYNKMGSRWSVIASHLEGRTDNDVKNYWNTKMRKKLLAAKSSMNAENNSSTNHLYANAYGAGYMEVISNSEFSSCPNGPEITKVPDYEIDTLSSFRDNANAGASWAENGGAGDHNASLFGSGSGLGSLSLSCPAADDDLLDGFDFLEEIIKSSDEMESSLRIAR